MMDLLTTILSRNQSGGALAKIETKKYTFDGDLTGKTTVNVDGVLFVKVSDTAIAKKEFAELSLKDDSGVLINFTAKECLVIEEAGVTFVSSVYDNTDVLIISDSTGDAMGAVGTYVVANRKFKVVDGSERTSYVSEIVTEVIHPLPDWAIPQIPASKLPGAVLPVVEISTMPVANEQIALTDAETLQLSKVLSDNKLALITLPLTLAVEPILARVADEEGHVLLAGSTYTLSNGVIGVTLFVDGDGTGMVLLTKGE